jgi:hypothetical protein
MSYLEVANADNKNYFVSVKDGKINEELLPAEIIK